MPPTKKRKSNSSRRRRIKNKSVRRKIRGGSIYVTHGQYTNPYTIYDKNTYMNDPSWPNAGNISARNIAGGKKKYKNSRKRGGTMYNADPLGSGPPPSLNPTFSLWDPWASASLVQGNGIMGTSYVHDNSNYVKGMV